MTLEPQMVIRIWDVEHGACAMLQHQEGSVLGRLAMIDSGSTKLWTPSKYITQCLGIRTLNYLFITNADQDHMSDLNGLYEEGIDIPVWYRNPSYTAQEIAALKLKSGPLTKDAQRYVMSCSSYCQPISEPFDDYMGGITTSVFFNTYPRFTDTNNLSLVIFIKYAGFKILFPGDIEKSGWTALLEQQAFRDELRGTDILVASHHGRESGYCSDIFNYFKPQAVIISDKPIQHETQQMVPDYRAVTMEDGVIVETTQRRRHVLTTRRDGSITIIAKNNGYYTIKTEKNG